MNIIVTGSLAYDYIMDFSGKFADRIMPDKIHQLSLSFLVDKLSKQFGGTAVNIAYSLKLLGIDPFIVAPAGNDFSAYKKYLQDLHISSDYIKEFTDVACGSYFGITDMTDNQIGAFFAGALKYAKDLKVASVTEQSALVMISPTDQEAMNNYVTECIDLKVPYMFDPAFQIGDFSPDDLRTGIEHAKFFIGNDYEVALVEKKLQLTHEQLLQLVPTLITTLGEKGSIIETQENGTTQKIEIRPAKPENISDPTGAGDAYRAGFLAGFVRGLGLVTCGQMGSIAAVYTVEKYGTQTHTYTTQEFKKRYTENYQSDLKI